MVNVNGTFKPCKASRGMMNSLAVLIQITAVFYPLNSLEKGARYEEEDGFKSLYLNGTAYATTPAVDFGKTSFTMASWVKLQSPDQHPATIYGYWDDPALFLFDAYAFTKLRFQMINSKRKPKPSINEG